MESFREILSVNLLHEFYNDGQCKSIQILPDADTQKWMESFGILWRQKENIGYMLVSESIDFDKSIVELTDFELKFNCISTNPNFVNFTDIPFDSVGFLSFSNEFVQQQNHVPIELSGIFQRSTITNNIIASVSLNVKDLSFDRESPVEFEIKFKSRVLPWKYYIMNSGQGNRSNLILGGKGSQFFSEGEKKTLPNNSTALVFDSRPNLLPVKENSPIALNLSGISNNNSSVSEILIEHLPNASPESFQPYDEGGIREIYAAIYIYL